MVAARITEQGTMRIGLVGSAKYAGGVELTAGLAAASGGLADPLFTAFDFGVVVLL